jgi:hypothetical protein
MRLPIIRQMAKVTMKGAETYLRHTYVVPLRQRIRGK